MALAFALSFAALAALALFILAVLVNTREHNERTLRAYLKRCGVTK